MNYDSFKTMAFIEYGINPQPLEVVRSWVLQHSRQGFYHKGDDLGYAELADIQTVNDAMAKLKEIIWQSTLMETDKKTAKALEQFNKDAGGREGKGFYRYALKAYYLTLEAAE